MRFHQLRSTAAFANHGGLRSVHPVHRVASGTARGTKAGGLLPAHRRVSRLLPRHPCTGSPRQAGPGPSLCPNRRQAFDSLGLSARGTEVAEHIPDAGGDCCPTEQRTKGELCG